MSLTVQGISAGVGQIYYVYMCKFMYIGYNYNCNVYLGHSYNVLQCVAPPIHKLFNGRGFM